ncbi:MAG: lysoplasmalogenase [Actinomycetota bacterium]
MTSLAWLLLAAAGVAAVIDWWAVARADKRVEYITKPATLLGLAAVALTLDPESEATRAWFVLALGFSVTGDVFLMLPGNLFVQGLAAFLVAHVAYVAGFVAGGLDGTVLIVASLVIAVFVMLYARFLITRMHARQRRLRVPVGGYAVAIGSMLTAAIAGRDVLAIAGALLFVLSDGLIGFSRFVRPALWAPLAIIITYHLAQAGLVLSLALN